MEVVGSQFSRVKCPRGSEIPLKRNFRRHSPLLATEQIQEMKIVKQCARIARLLGWKHRGNEVLSAQES